MRAEGRNEMLKRENIQLKNKVAELKERVAQIYSQSALEVHKSKTFESEFSLYLKACEHARNERKEGIRLQHHVTKFGLAILTFFLAFTVYLFHMRIVFGTLSLVLGYCFVLCGLMYLLLAEEIRIVRARDYCYGLETYFKRHRWSIEKNAPANLSDMPLWEEYRINWEKDLFGGGPYGKTVVYAPFRIAMTLMDLFVLVYLVYFFIGHRSEISWTELIIGCIVWIVAVTVQMLIVNGIIKVAAGLEVEQEGPEANQEKGIGWKPATWLVILKLFLNQDIIFPSKSERVKEQMTQL